MGRSIRTGRHRARVEKIRAENGYKDEVDPRTGWRRNVGIFTGSAKTSLHTPWLPKFPEKYMGEYRIEHLGAEEDKLLLASNRLYSIATSIVMTKQPYNVTYRRVFYDSRKLPKNRQ